MRPTTDISPTLLDNTAAFRDPFFQRFSLRRAPNPLALTDTISKDYLFPTLYADVTCAIGIFLCDYERARAILPHPAMRPVRMTLGRSLVAFSCYEYKNVLGVTPYNEIAMTIPVLVGTRVDVPVLPMIVSGMPGFGYYVFGMPVTSKENQIRGNKIWGLPKVTQAVDIDDEDGACVTVAREDDGRPYFTLRVPTTGKPTRFDVRAKLYSRLGGRLLRSETCFRATFAVNKYMSLLAKRDAVPAEDWLSIGEGPSADVLRELRIERHPFQFRFARHMTSAFDLPDPGYQLSAVEVP
jgi:hypothetical protein